MKYSRDNIIGVKFRGRSGTIYTIVEFNDDSVIIEWVNVHNETDCQTYSKDHVVIHLNKETWTVIETDYDIF